MRENSKSFALDESKDSEVSETDLSFTDASNDESDESFVKSEEEFNNESDCALTDQEDDKY